MAENSSIWMQELLHALRESPAEEVMLAGFCCTRGWLADILERADRRRPTVEKTLLHEVYEAIHELRLAKDEGTLRGPDNFYNGVVNSRLAVLRVAAQHGLSEEEVRRG